jgi:hypothetical protein
LAFAGRCEQHHKWYVAEYNRKKAIAPRSPPVFGAVTPWNVPLPFSAAPIFMQGPVNFNITFTGSEFPRLQEVLPMFSGFPAAHASSVSFNGSDNSSLNGNFAPAPAPEESHSSFPHGGDPRAVGAEDFPVSSASNTLSSQRLPPPDVPVHTSSSLQVSTYDQKNVSYHGDSGNLQDLTSHTDDPSYSTQASELLHSQDDPCSSDTDSVVSFGGQCAQEELLCSQKASEDSMDSDALTEIATQPTDVEAAVRNMLLSPVFLSRRSIHAFFEEVGKLLASELESVPPRKLKWTSFNCLKLVLACLNQQPIPNDVGSNLYLLKVLKNLTPPEFELQWLGLENPNCILSQLHPSQQQFGNIALGKEVEHVCCAKEFLKTWRAPEENLEPNDSPKAFAAMLQSLDWSMVSCATSMYSSSGTCAYHEDLAYLGLGVVDLLLHQTFDNETDKVVKKSWCVYLQTHAVCSLTQYGTKIATFIPEIKDLRDFVGFNTQAVKKNPELILELAFEAELIAGRSSAFVDIVQQLNALETAYQKSTAAKKAKTRFHASFLVLARFLLQTYKALNRTSERVIRPPILTLINLQTSPDILEFILRHSTLRFKGKKADIGAVNLDKNCEDKVVSQILKKMRNEPGLEGTKHLCCLFFEFMNIVYQERPSN